MIRVCDAWIRSQQDTRSGQPAISLICATTALAAQNFQNATTAHSLFKIPADDIDQDAGEEGAIRSKLPSFPGAQELIDAARFIAWDEFPSTHRHVFEACNNVTRGFQGKILLCTGDLRQLTPVVKSTCIQNHLHASIVFSSTWQRFTLHRLTQNFRQLSDPTYAQWAESVGEGRDGGTYTPELRYSATVDLSQFLSLTFSSASTIEALQWVYPELRIHLSHTNTETASHDVVAASPAGDRPCDPILQRAIHMAKSAILANTNDRVNEWNKHVQQLIGTSKSHTYFSEDSLCDIHSDDKIREVVTQEFMHYCDKADVPIHGLHLKVGDLCILMRNIDKSSGLTNNQRVIIRDLTPYSIVISIASDRTLTRHWIPRIKFRFTIPGTSFDMIRKQFPLKLAYAFTVHKAQGQELKRVLIDTTTPTFAHGQLYVALSRVRHRNAIAAFIPEEQRLQGVTTAENVVFVELVQLL